MIGLYLEPYCQEGCRNFEADTVRIGYEDLEVRCANATKCKYMIRYLEKHAEVKSDDNDS